MKNEKILFPTYIVIDSTIYIDRRLSSTDKVLYGLIVALSNNEKRSCYAQNRYFAMAMDLKKRQVQRCLNSLSKYGYIIIKYLNGKRMIQTTTDNSIIERNLQNNVNNNKIEVFNYDWLNEEE